MLVGRLCCFVGSSLKWWKVSFRCSSATPSVSAPFFELKNHRGKGLVGSSNGDTGWLQICLNSNALPRSKNINKPLLSLVLANFGLIPVSDSAIEVEISPIANVQDSNTQRSWKPLFALYSLRPLHFGERELRIQRMPACPHARMVVTRFPPSPRGKMTAVKTIFEHPMTQNARNGEDFRLCKGKERIVYIYQKCMEGGKERQPTTQNIALCGELFRMTTPRPKTPQFYWPKFKNGWMW